MKYINFNLVTDIKAKTKIGTKLCAALTNRTARQQSTVSMHAARHDWAYVTATLDNYDI